MKKILILLSVILFSFSACKQNEVKTGNYSNKVYVKVQPAIYGYYSIPVRSTGLLSTRQEMKLSFKTGGIVRKVAVRDGQSVEKGQVLVVLDMLEINAQVKQANIAWEKAGRDLNRIRNLYRDSVATLENYQDARSAYELAKAQKQIADFNKLHSKIVAPSKGKIQKVLVESNEIIAPGYPALMFASTANDWVVRTAITDKDIVSLSPGDSAFVLMDAFPGDTIQAELVELGALADPVTATYEVELRIIDPYPGFRTGFIAHAEIYPSELKSGVMVPMEALLNASDKFAEIYVVRKGTYHKIRVKTAEIVNDLVSVSGDVFAGDSVVVDGASYLGKDSEMIISE